MMSNPFGTGGLSGAQAKISSKFHNLSGNQFANSTFSGNVVFGAIDNAEEKCKLALCQNVKDPEDVRSVLDRRFQKKFKITSSVFNWILNTNSFKSWKQAHFHSQLLWISGGTGMGKTPLAIFLISELKNKIAFEQAGNCVILYYFCDGKDHTQNHAVSILRGLMLLLIKARPELLKVLLSDYGFQGEALFSQTSLEALWRNFKNMTREPAAGRVYCVIDGIDQCGEESLEDLLDILKEFFDEEKKQYELRQAQNANTTAYQEHGTDLQMILISREAPKIISEALEGFLRIPLEPVAKKEPKLVRKKTVKLATVAREVLRRDTARGSAITPTGTTTIASAVSVSSHGSNVSTVLDPAQESGITSTLAYEQVQVTTPLPTSISATQPTPPTPLSTISLPTPATAPATAATSSVDPSNPDSLPSPIELASDTQPSTVTQTQTSETSYEVVEEEIYEEEEVEGEASENQSLALYIKERIADLATERAYSEAVVSSLATKLDNRGDGTFLWVDLAIEEIKRYQPQDAEQVVEQLPTNINEIYCRILQNIPQNMASLVIAILRWVLAARRPLLVVELAAALTLMNYHSFNPTDLARQGILACGPMITVDEEDTVHVANNSVKDLLTSETSPLRTNAALFPFFVSMGDTDGEIASLSLHYLEQGCLNNGSVPSDGQEKYFKHVAQFPLFPYAVEFWPDHLRSATRPQINFGSPFFAKESKIRKNWWFTYWPSTTGKWPMLTPRNFTILHLASYLNLQFLAQQLAMNGELQVNLEKRDSHGSTPLSYAAELGHLDMFILLLGRGAKLEVVGGNVFELAAQKGQAEIVEYLLKNGYPVNKPSTSVSALESVGMMTKYISGTLSEGIKTDRDQWKLITRDVGDAGTALIDASLFGHVSVVEILLKWGANVRATTTKNWTALHAASWTGQIECVKLLLEKGADAGAVTQFGWIPFHCAASRGKPAVVELYLKLGMPVDTLTVKQKSALHLSAYGGNAATVKMLVEYGANLNAQSYKGETPLHLATRNQRPEIVELLLSLGANKFIINGAGFTASDYLRNLKNGGTDVQREMFRILETYGMPGYILWRPKQDANALVVLSNQPLGAQATGQPDHLRRASTASTFTMPQPTGQPAFGFGTQQQPDPNTKPAFGAQQPMFNPQNPMAQPFGAQQQPFVNPTQPFGVQQPMYANQSPPLQTQSQFFGGAAIQLNMSSQPGQPTPQRTGSIPTPLSQQNTADSNPAPPPYTPSSPQGSPQNQAPVEKPRQFSVPSINVQPASNLQQQTSPIMNSAEVKSPLVTTHEIPPSSPAVSSPQEIHNQPPLQSAQFGASPAPTPVPTTSISQAPPQIQVAVAPTPQLNFQQPISNTGLNYGAHTPVATQQPYTPQPQPNQPQPQIYQPQPSQAPLHIQPPQQQFYQAPQATQSPPVQQPMTTPPIQGFQQQFSQMSLNSTPSPGTPYSSQPQQQQWNVPQAPPSPYSPQPQAQQWNAAPNTQPQPQQWNAPQNPQSPYSPQPTQQQWNNPQQPYQQPYQQQQQGQQGQQFSPYPQQQQQQGSGFLSVGVGIPSGLFGAQNGSMGSAMSFAPPPSGQMGMKKKKSFMNLGGLL